MKVKNARLIRPLGGNPYLAREEIDGQKVDMWLDGEVLFLTANGISYAVHMSHVRFLQLSEVYNGRDDFLSQPGKTVRKQELAGRAGTKRSHPRATNNNPQIPCITIKSTST